MDTKIIKKIERKAKRRWIIDIERKYGASWMQIAQQRSVWTVVPARHEKLTIETSKLSAGTQQLWC